MASRALAVVLFTLAVSISAAAAAGAADDTRLGWARAGRDACRGTIGECLGDGEEFDLESESSRRILATSNYISYDALKRDSVPCSRPGNSYYNCQPGATANPYTRGCSAITQCRS